MAKEKMKLIRNDGRYTSQRYEGMLKDAEYKVRSIGKKSNRIGKYLYQALNGKNQTIRKLGLMAAWHEVETLLGENNPWFEVIEAKKSGKDIHRDELKSKKLHITGAPGHEFAQYIVDTDNENEHLKTDEEKEFSNED